MEPMALMSLPIVAETEENPSDAAGLDVESPDRPWRT